MKIYIEAEQTGQTDSSFWNNNIRQGDQVPGVHATGISIILSDKALTPAAYNFPQLT